MKTKDGANKSYYQPATLSMYTPSPKNKTSLAGVKRRQKRQTKHTCAFPRRFHSSQNAFFFVLPLLIPHTSGKQCMHAAEKRGELRVVGNDEEKTSIDHKARKKAEKATIVFVPIPTSGILRGNERVNQ